MSPPARHPDGHQAEELKNKDEQQVSHEANRYERIRVLGKGSFGTAILHRRQLDNLLVVLKEIDLHRFKQDQERLKLVIQEARIMSRLSHPNIIQYLSAYTTDSAKLIIEMEYARMGTLQTYLSLQTKALEELEILNIFSQILAGLEYLHSQSIVHLDLKMANIFVTSEGSIKIGDFGIAKLMSRSCPPAAAAAADRPTGPAQQHEGGHRQRLTSSASAHYGQLGTLAYSSPERCLGEPTDFKSDIWSLGCLLYELVELRPLFAGESLPELVMSITQVRFEPMRRQDVRPELRELFVAMIAREPHARPSASELAAQADHLLAASQQPKSAVSASGPLAPRGGKPNNKLLAQLPNQQGILAASSPLDTGPSPSSNLAQAGGARLPPPAINYPHSLVYQVRLSSRDIQVERVNLPQSKRVKEMSKGHSHYLVLTYDNIVYGWGTRHLGQLGASFSATTSNGNNPTAHHAASGNLLFATGGTTTTTTTTNHHRQQRRSPGARSIGVRHTRSARNSLTAKDLQVLGGAPAPRRQASGGRGQARCLTQPSSLSSSTQTLAAGLPATHSGSRQHIAESSNAPSPITSRPFVMSELNKRKIIRVAAGRDFSVFLSKTGIVMTCGDGSRGCLGRASLASSHTPCMVEGLLNMDVVDVACGPEHVVAVCGNGQVFAWGNSRHGRLGLSAQSLQAGSGGAPGDAHLVVTPQLVEFRERPPGGKKLHEEILIKSAFCGDRCTVFVDSQHNCWACGENRFNKLGLDVKQRFKKTTLVECAWEPVRIRALSKGRHKVISCQVAKNHASYLTSEGKLLVFGQDIDHSYRLLSNTILAGQSWRRISSELRSSRGTSTGGSIAREVEPLPNEQLGRQRHLRQLTNHLLAHDKLANFKLQKPIATNSSLRLAKSLKATSAKRGQKPQISRDQKRSIETYLKRSRSSRRMPFECVLNMSCTRNFTLALTSDNRVYFWGTRTRDKEPRAEVNLEQQQRQGRWLRRKDLNCRNSPKFSVEPQLVGASSSGSQDDPAISFIKIGATNNSLMSSIQMIGSDQPILHARNPQLIAQSPADLWILDYRPASACDTPTCSSCSSWDSRESLWPGGNDASDDSHEPSCSCHCDCTCSESCSISSNSSSCPSRCNSDASCSLECSLNEDHKPKDKRHDAILEPQPIISLYVPSLFKYNGCALQLVNLFCFDDDRFFLILDTTAKLVDSSSAASASRPSSRRGSLSLKHLATGAQNQHHEGARVQAHMGSRQVHQNHHHHHHHQQQQHNHQSPGGILATAVAAGPRLNMVEESKGSSGGSGGHSAAQQVAPSSKGEKHATPPAEANNNQARAGNGGPTVPECCRPVALDDERAARESEIELSSDVTLRNSGNGTQGGDSLVVSASPPISNTGLSLEEPRSMSTFAPGAFNGQQLVLRRPSMPDGASSAALGGRELMRKLSFEQSHTSSAFGPVGHLLLNGNQKVAREANGRSRRKSGGKRTARLLGRRWRRGAAARNGSESTAATLDDTSSMPTWVRNEYLQQLSCASPELQLELDTSSASSDGLSVSGNCEPSIESQSEQTLVGLEQQIEMRSSQGESNGELSSADSVATAIKLGQHDSPEIDSRHSPPVDRDQWPIDGRPAAHRPLGRSQSSLSASQANKRQSNSRSPPMVEGNLLECAVYKATGSRSSASSFEPNERAQVGTRFRGANKNRDTTAAQTESHKQQLVALAHSFEYLSSRRISHTSSDGSLGENRNMNQTAETTSTSARLKSNKSASCASLTSIKKSLGRIFC